MFDFAYPAETCTYITAGFILMLAAPFSIRKIWQGSKSAFAYALLAFTFLEGFQFFIRFFILIIRHPIIVGGETYYAVNFYAYETADFCDNIVSLQNWIFAINYLESALFCSLTDPCISPYKVRTILRVGIIGYGLAMVVILICVMATFPGYVSNNSTE